MILKYKRIIIRCTIKTVYLVQLRYGFVGLSLISIDVNALNVARFDGYLDVYNYNK